MGSLLGLNPSVASITAFLLHQPGLWLVSSLTLHEDLSPLESQKGNLRVSSCSSAPYAITRLTQTFLRWFYFILNCFYVMSLICGIVKNDTNELIYTTEIIFTDI